MRLAQMNSKVSSQRSLPFRDPCERSERPPVSIIVAHPGGSDEFVSGFAHLWAMYVCGFDQKRHCQKALRGRLSTSIQTRATPLNVPLVLGEAGSYDSLYICGVAKGPLAARRVNNLHLAIQPQEGASFVHETYNGYSLRVDNGVKLSIPELPKGWNGLPDEYTRCCNFRFCVHRFGYRSQPHQQICATR
jgi:hypothetical protein